MNDKAPNAKPAKLRSVGVFEWIKTLDHINFDASREFSAGRSRIRGKTIKGVATRLAYFADTDGSKVLVGLARLAAICETDYKTAKRVRATLVGAGLLEQVRRGGGFGGSNTTEFRLSLPVNLAEVVALRTSAGLDAEVARVAAANGLKGRESDADSQGSGNPVSDPGEHDSRGTANPVSPGRDLDSRGTSAPTHGVLLHDSRGTANPPTFLDLPIPSITCPDAAPTAGQPPNQPKKEDQQKTQLPEMHREALRIIRSSLDTTDPGATDTEVQAIHRKLAAKATGLNYFKVIAEKTGYTAHLAAVRAAAADQAAADRAATENEYRRLAAADQPLCHPDGIPGGANTDPRTGKPICPHCRRGIPHPTTTPANSPATNTAPILAAYQTAWLAAGHNTREEPETYRNADGQLVTDTHTPKVDAMRLTAVHRHATNALNNGHHIDHVINAARNAGAADTSKLDLPEKSPTT